MNKTSSIVQFIKTSGIFFVGAVLSKAISILLLPLYTRRIPTDEMGYYDLSLTYITIITSVLFFDIWVSILRFMYDGKTKDDKACIIKSGSRIFCYSAIGYFLVGCILAVTGKFQYIGLMIGYGISQNIAQLFSFCSRGFGKNKEFAISGIINTLINVTLNVVLIAGFSINFSALYISAICGFISQAIYLACTTDMVTSLVKSSSEKSITLSIFKYSLPLCVNSVAYWVLTSLNRVVLNRVYGNSANGLFAIGNKFSFVIALATTCFTYAWQDLSFSKANELGNDGTFYSRGCDLYTKVLTICTCLALPVIKVIFPFLVKGDYVGVDNTIPLFLINSMIAAVSTFVGNVFYAIKDTKTIFISMVASALLNICIGYPLIKIWDINGANLSIIISFVLNIFIRNIVLKKKVGFRFDIKIFPLLLWLAVVVLIYVFCSNMINIVFFILTVSVSFWIFRDSLNGIFKLVRGRH